MNKRATNFKEMVDNTMRNLFSARKLTIETKELTAEECDNYIKERGNFYKDKYDNMNAGEAIFDALMFVAEQRVKEKENK